TLSRLNIKLRPIVTDAGDIAGQRLIASKIKATSDDVRTIGAVPNVTEVHFLSCELPSEVFASFANNTLLKDVYLDSCVIPVSAFRDLASRKGMSYLRIDGRSFDDERMEALSNGLQVEELQFSDTSLTDTGVAKMQAIKGLRKLTIHS